VRNRRLRGRVEYLDQQIAAEQPQGQLDASDAGEGFFTHRLVGIGDQLANQQSGHVVKVIGDVRAVPQESPGGKPRLGR
jgi:hypothetical protein